jgi:hypothetical protein
MLLPDEILSARSKSSCSVLARVLEGTTQWLGLVALKRWPWCDKVRLEAAVGRRASAGKSCHVGGRADVSGLYGTLVCTGARGLVQAAVQRHVGNGCPLAAAADTSQRIQTARIFVAKSRKSTEVAVVDEGRHGAKQAVALLRRAHAQAVLARHLRRA